MECAAAPAAAAAESGDAVSAECDAAGMAAAAAALAWKRVGCEGRGGPRGAGLGCGDGAVRECGMCVISGPGCEIGVGLGPREQRP